MLASSAKFQHNVLGFFVFIFLSRIFKNKKAIKEKGKLQNRQTPI